MVYHLVCTLGLLIFFDFPDVTFPCCNTSDNSDDLERTCAINCNCRRHGDGLEATCTVHDSTVACLPHNFSDATLVQSL